MESKVFSYYCDIVQGSIMVFMFIAIQLAINGISVIPMSIVDGIPQSEAMAALSPMSQGDLLIIALLTYYGVIWGLRLISNAIDGLRELSKIDFELQLHSTS